MIKHALKHMRHTSALRGCTEAGKPWRSGGNGGSQHEAGGVRCLAPHRCRSNPGSGCLCLSRHPLQVGSFRANSCWQKASVSRPDFPTSYSQLDKEKIFCFFFSSSSSYPQKLTNNLYDCIIEPDLYGNDWIMMMSPSMKDYSNMSRLRRQIQVSNLHNSQ